jgi:hypothetical protein
MRRIGAALLVLVPFLALWAPANAAPPAGVPARMLGVLPARVASASASGNLGLGNLSYHGGPVQTGATPAQTYAIFWGNGMTTQYGSLIVRFFQDVAADSGLTSNTYFSDTQYSQNVGGVTTPITYNQSFGGYWHDSTVPTTSGCSSTAGGPLCVSDGQVQQEVARAISVNNWPTGLGAEYFVFLSNGMSTCDGSSCAFSSFCAYHSNATLNGSPVLYANMPYTGHNLSSCGGGNYPNGNSAADATINVTSHEANETVTDPQGTSWYDLLGYENGDKCAWNFGTQLGGSSGSRYNQVINGNHYELQQEWSNARKGCVLTGT